MVKISINDKCELIIIYDVIVKDEQGYTYFQIKHALLSLHDSYIIFLHQILNIKTLSFLSLFTCIIIPTIATYQKHHLNINIIIYIFFSYYNKLSYNRYRAASFIHPILAILKLQIELQNVFNTKYFIKVIFPVLLLKGM